MTDKKVLSCILENSIFSSADPNNIYKYICTPTTEITRYSGGEIIVSPQSLQKRIGIVLSGSALVSPASYSENAMLRIIERNDMFGISNLFSDNDFFPSVITAKTSTEIIFIDGQDFKSFLYSDPSAMAEYLKTLNKKIIYLNRKISTLTAGTAEKKLAFFLCENEHNGVYASTASISSLANMLNVGSASLYIDFDTLTNEGLIIKSVKNILIPDKDALLNYN